MIVVKHRMNSYAAEPNDVASAATTPLGETFFLSEAEYQTSYSSSAIAAKL